MAQSVSEMLSLIQSGLDQIDDCIAIYDSDLCLVSWNRAFAEIPGFPKELVKTGTPVRDLIRWNAERGIYGDGDIEALVKTRFDLFKARQRTGFERVLLDGTVMQLEWYPLPEGGMVTLFRDVTESALREESLRHQASMIEGMHDAVFVSDHDGKIVGWNRGAARLLGYERDELLGKHCRMLLAEDERLVSQIEIRGGIEKFGVFQTERRFAKKSGEQFVGAVSISQLTDIEGPPDRFVAVVRDVTGQKQSEAEAVRVRQRFEAFMENIPAIAFIKDAEGRYIFVNKIFEDSLGTGQTDWRAKTDFELWNEEVARQFRANDAIVLGSKRPLVVEERIATKEGERVYLVSKFPIETNHGKTMLGGLALDITDAKKTEQALQESEARLRGVHENAADGIFTIDEKGTIESANRAGEEMFGYGPGELVGKDVAVLMGGEHQAQHQSYIDRYLETGKGQILGVGPRELTGIRKDGSEIAIDLAVNVMKLGERRIFVGVARDVSDRKETRRQLQQAQKMEAIGQLTGGIAHDFNNMLAVVLGNLELAVERFRQGRDITKLLHLALQGATRGSDLTQRLLAFSRQQFLEPRRVDINETIGEMADILHRTIGENIEVILDFSQELWPAKIDPSQLQSAILNLALNGRDAMPDGGRLQITTVNLGVGAESWACRQGLEAGEYVVVAVKDDGTGISADHMERIFEPFFTTKEVGKGSGLGLSMVYGFARQSGGRAFARSEAGAGTELQIYLPRCHEDANLPVRTRIPAAEELQDRSVLLVEDDHEVRVLIAEYLKAMGFRVIEAEDGNHVVAILERGQQFDLLLTDMVLPGGMGGRDVSRRVRAAVPDAKILYMSGYAAHSMLDGERIEESERLIQKPFRRRELQDTVREILAVSTVD